MGRIYLLSIVVMEFIIMPQYVYQPAAADAERRTKQRSSDDRENELIDEQFILDDEIGHIMRSRNATVAQLRQQEDDLATRCRSWKNRTAW